MGVKQFLMELFDANFDRFLAISIIKILYILALVATTAVVGSVVVAGLAGVFWSDAPAAKILGPVLVLSVGGALYLLGALLARLCCETILVGYRVAENTGRLVAQANGALDDRTEPANPPAQDTGRAASAVA